MRVLWGAKQRRITRIEQGKRSDTNFVVLHDTESDNIDGVENYFRTSSPDEVGAHIGISTKGETRQWADLDAIVYHARGANAVSVGIEICGYASQSRARWLRRRSQRIAVAEAIARICNAYKLGLPTSGKNVKLHSEIVAGGHHDPGPNFPRGKVMELARKRYRKWYG